MVFIPFEPAHLIAEGAAAWLYHRNIVDTFLGIKDIAIKKMYKFQVA